MNPGMILPLSFQGWTATPKQTLKSYNGPRKKNPSHIDLHIPLEGSLQEKKKHAAFMCFHLLCLTFGPPEFMWSTCQVAQLKDEDRLLTVFKCKLAVLLGKNDRPHPSEQSRTNKRTGQHNWRYPVKPEISGICNQLRYLWKRCCKNGERFSRALNSLRFAIDHLPVMSRIKGGFKLCHLFLPYTAGN